MFVGTIIIELMDIKTNYLGVNVTRPDQELIIMRGIPGSGKSTRAKSIVGSGIIHSTDDLIEATGDYEGHFKRMVANDDWSPHHKMHQTNYNNAKKSLSQGISPVIIDNTNLSPTECRPYVVVALEMGFSDENIKIEDVGTGGLSAEQLAQRNTHNVPLESIEKMITKYNSNKVLTVEKIVGDNPQKSNDILYSSVVLLDQSKGVIIDKFGTHIPEGWKVFNHHMTVCFGKGLPEELKGDLGTNKTLWVTHLGKSNMALAAKVQGYHSDNKHPHITIAVNTPEGGKPVMSNDITNWVELSSPFRIIGVVTEHTR